MTRWLTGGRSDSSSSSELSSTLARRPPLLVGRGGGGIPSFEGDIVRERPGDCDSKLSDSSRAGGILQTSERLEGIGGERGAAQRE